ncbi:homeobox-leucine zipper protein HOX19-like [Musa acuminata AAA Group]|uniref:homeobox-leucine zipper protein HOX19-like n=1 Tax=Musa acuminata AAA Group TaxID=214697 RepID=UPI0031D6F02B
MDVCDTSLALGLGVGGRSTAPSSGTTRRRQEVPCSPLRSLMAQKQPSLMLSLPHDVYNGEANKGSEEGRQARPSSPHSTVSSFSTAYTPTTMKKEKDDGGGGGGGGEEADTARADSRGGSYDDNDDGSPRKKLRLTKEQSALLEDRFKEHSTLNPKQKHALAKQLNLRPRQVEVWFQNRRARTKLKQTEVDCEFLKRCCESLTDENRRLHKELQELKALKLAPPPVCMQFPAATLTMCPSCKTIRAAADGPKGGGAEPFVVAPAKHHFFHPFIHSASC